ncbi:MAG TPA: phosphotransferase [Myxococcota bacterium]|nr:phosphotransferase [Myxococcota bacterium]
MTPALPDPLCALLARERLTVARAEEVTSLGRREGTRRTFRLELSGGALAKGRTHRTPEVAQRMARWIPFVAPHGYAALRGAHDTATLEEWVEGAPLDARDPDGAEQAGALLGACHGALPCEEIAASDPRLVAWWDDCVAWIAEIRAGAHLDGAEAERVASRLRALRPQSARWGLYHGDFHPDNLVVDAGRVRCVDNTTVRPHLLEVDPGFAFNRWPLDGALRERFLRGYRRHADPSRFLADEPFWRISAAVRSAAYRVRERSGNVELPLGELAGLVA